MSKAMEDFRVKRVLSRWSARLWLLPLPPGTLLCSRLDSVALVAFPITYLEQEAIYGVLYTVAKEDKVDENALRTFWLQLLSILLDYAQLTIFVVNSNYPWVIPWHNPFIDFLMNIQIQNFFIKQPFSVFASAFFIFSASIVFCCALCVAVARFFMSGSFPVVWPIAVLKVYASVVLDTFYISALNIFLVALDCNLFRSHTVKQKDGTYLIQKRYYNQNYPSQYCFAPVNAVMFSFGLVLSIVAVVLSGFKTLTSARLDLTNRTLTACIHSQLELRLWLVKSAITAVAIFLSLYRSLQAWFVLATSAYILFVVLRRAPFMNRNVNNLYAGLYATLLWICACLVPLLLFKKKVNASTVTTVMLVGYPVAFLIGWYLMLKRLQRPSRIAQKIRAALDEGLEPGGLHRFWDAFEVEVATRCALERHPRTREITKCSADVAQLILEEGLLQFPDSAFLHITLSNFCISIRGDFKTGVEWASKAKALPLSFEEKFMIFVRDRETKQRGEGGGDSADLLSYVEFQRSFTLCVQTYRQAAAAVRGFWYLLLGHHVSYRKLFRVLRDMETAENKADELFRSVLHKFPKSVKLLHLFSSYIEAIKKDPIRAQSLLDEAERLEDQQAEAHREALIAAQGTDGLAEDLTTTLSEGGHDAIVIINGEGIISFTNRTLTRMFGYKRGELEGKNVSLLMPEPFSKSHNQYLRNYRTTGKAKILNSPREVVALHKDKYVFPIMLFVNKLASGNEVDGATMTFIGFVRRAQENPTKGTIYITSQGQILCCNKAFTGMSGWEMSDLIGRNLWGLAKDPEHIRSEIQQGLDAVALAAKKEADAAGIARKLTLRNSGRTYSTRDSAGRDSKPVGPIGPAGVASGTLNSMDEPRSSAAIAAAQSGGPVHTFETSLKSCYTAKEVHVDVQVHSAGTAGQVLLVLHIMQLDLESGIMGVGEDGSIRFCSTSLESLLGYRAGSLNTGGVMLGSLLPFPYTLLHRRYTDDLLDLLAHEESGLLRTSPVSCSSGRVVYFRGKDAGLVPVTLNVNLTRKGGQTVFGASVKVSRPHSDWSGDPPDDEGLVQASRVRVIVDCNKGTIIMSDLPPRTAGRGAGLFGLYREDLAGARLAETLDLFSGAVESAKTIARDVDALSVSRSLLRQLEQQARANAIASLRVQLRGADWKRGRWAEAALVPQPDELMYLSVERMLHAGLDVPNDLSLYLQEGPALPAGQPQGRGSHLGSLLGSRTASVTNMSGAGSPGLGPRLGSNSSLLQLTPGLAGPTVSAPLEPPLADYMVLDLYDPEALHGCFEVNKTGEFTMIDRSASILLGVSQEAAPSLSITSLFVQPALDRGLSMLGLRPGKLLGDRVSLDLYSCERSVFTAEIVCAQRTEDGARLQGVIRQVASLTLHDRDGASHGRLMEIQTGGLPFGLQAPEPEEPSPGFGPLAGTDGARAPLGPAETFRRSVYTKNAAQGYLQQGRSRRFSVTSEISSRSGFGGLHIQPHAPGNNTPPHSPASLHAGALAATGRRASRQLISSQPSSGALLAKQGGSPRPSLRSIPQHKSSRFLVPSSSVGVAAAPARNAPPAATGLASLTSMDEAISDAPFEGVAGLARDSSALGALESIPEPHTAPIQAADPQADGGDVLWNTWCGAEDQSKAPAGSLHPDRASRDSRGSSRHSTSHPSDATATHAHHSHKQGADLPVGGRAAEGSHRHRRSSLSSLRVPAGFSPAPAQDAEHHGLTDLRGSPAAPRARRHSSVQGPLDSAGKQGAAGHEIRRLGIRRASLTSMGLGDVKAQLNAAAASGDAYRLHAVAMSKPSFTAVLHSAGSITLGSGASFSRGIPGPVKRKKARQPGKGLALLAGETQGSRDVEEAGLTLTLTQDEEAVSTNEVDDAEKSVHQSDYTRLRRSRKITQQLRSRSARKATSSLSLKVKLISALFILGHVMVFAVYQYYLKAIRTVVDAVSESGLALHSLQATVLAGQQLQLAVSIDYSDAVLNLGSVENTKALLQSSALRFENIMFKALRELEAKKMVKESAYHLTLQPLPTMISYEGLARSHLSVYQRYVPLWEACRAISMNAVAAADSVPTNGTVAGPGFAPALAYLTMNGLDQVYFQLQDVLQVVAMPEVLRGLETSMKTFMVLLIAEGALLTPIIGLAIYAAGKRVIAIRANLFAVLLLVPKYAIVPLATRVVQIGDGSDDEDGLGPGASSAVPIEYDGINKLEMAKLEEEARELKQQQLAGFSAARFLTTQNKGGRQLKMEASVELYKLVAPYVFFGLLLVIFSGISTVLFNYSVNGLGALQHVNHLYQLSARTRAFALQLVSSAPDVGNVAASRMHLNTTVADYEQSFNVLVYNNVIHINQKTNAAIKSLLFETTACLRDAENSPACPIQGQPLYDLISHGLAVAFTAFIDRARLFAQAPLSELVPNSTLFQEIWALGAYDLTGGLGKIRTMIVHETGTQLAVIELVHILVLIVIVLAAGVSYWTLLPLVKRTHVEARRMADLLADLPPELQVEEMVRLSFQTAPEDVKQRSDSKDLKKKASKFTFQNFMRRLADAHRVYDNSLFRGAKGRKPQPRSGREDEADGGSGVRRGAKKRREGSVRRRAAAAAPRRHMGESESNSETSDSLDGSDGSQGGGRDQQQRRGGSDSDSDNDRSRRSESGRRQ